MTDIEALRHQAAKGGFRLTRHAQLERMADGIAEEEIEEALTGAELVEDYPDDPRGPSCLLLGFSQGNPLHMVCGVSLEVIVVITVYRPFPVEWEPGWRMRKLN